MMSFELRNKKLIEVSWAEMGKGWKIVGKHSYFKIQETEGKE